jgi:hypothetical protein
MVRPHCSTARVMVKITEPRDDYMWGYWNSYLLWEYKTDKCFGRLVVKYIPTQKFHIYFLHK